MVVEGTMGTDEVATMVETTEERIVPLATGDEMETGMTTLVAVIESE